VKISLQKSEQRNLKFRLQDKLLLSKEKCLQEVINYRNKHEIPNQNKVKITTKYASNSIMNYVRLHAKSSTNSVDSARCVQVPVFVSRYPHLSPLDENVHELRNRIYNPFYQNVGLSNGSQWMPSLHQFC
jgi:hypothetical protein